MGLNPIPELSWIQHLIHWFKWKLGLCLGLRDYEFSNIVYGRVLLIKGEYLKLIGIAEQFLGIASVFPNLLANIYTLIYIAAANEKINRHDDAIVALEQAFEIAIPDKI